MALSYNLIQMVKQSHRKVSHGRQPGRPVPERLGHSVCWSAPFPRAPGIMGAETSIDVRLVGEVRPLEQETSSPKQRRVRERHRHGKRDEVKWTGNMLRVFRCRRANRTDKLAAELVDRTQV